MRKICTIAGICLALSDQAPAYGQAGALFSQFAVDASVPLQFATNTLLTPANTRSDFFLSPSLKLSALGSVDASLGYSIFAYVNPEPYWRVHAADGGFATLGGRVDKDLGNNFRTGAIYEHNWVFDGVFRSLAFQADDFSGFIAYSYGNLRTDGYSIQPSFKTTYRLADIASQDRFLFTLKAVLTKALTKELSFALTPSLKYYVFTDGIAAGKQNIWPSLLGELNYSLSRDVSLGGSVEYDRRWSNRAGSDFTNWIFLASVTFGHTYDLLPRK